MDLVAQRLGYLLAAPAVAQRDGDGALGAILADDVFVEFGDDFSGRHVGCGHESGSFGLGGAGGGAAL
ncbi:hypothetical protein WJ968_26735 [Achromobacter xylosoxidans]